MGETVEFPSNGHTCGGYLATPPSGRGPGVVVIQEYWGVNAHVRDLCDRFAAEGFVALAPDLYHGKETKEPDEAGKLLMELDLAEAARDMLGAGRWLATSDRTAGDRVGIVGFSAGGRVTSGVAFHYLPEGRPAFVAPIYAGGGISKDVPVPADAPPMFVAAATDDSLGLAPESVNLYERWTDAHKSAELHLYAKGGHGFGMRQQHLPSDHWIDRFADWLELQGWLKK